MRKAQKKQAEDFVTLLRRAHNEIKKAIESNNQELALDLLEQCQSGAIELGQSIEASEGENFITISKLEHYCEIAYQTYEQVRLLSSISGHKIYKTLNKSLVQIENSIRQDIPVRIEAVFLPYKASMWDSLESVWKAADEDPDCDAYVIPIPYYDRDSEGKFCKVHYEGDQYPEYVPITKYQEYDFAESRPDFIFIHNPYDNTNYVTSVHPFFYSDKLKQYTDQLVYIPYFILGEPDPEDKECIKGMAHFCTVPGVINADKVIVQSEAMRQAYINVLSMVVGEHTRKHWEQKILGLGSPKVDKVLETQKEDVVVPKEWQRVIEKEDGSWKKVVFYNTSVAALLQHSEKMIEKIKDVLQVFQKNQEEVALLWRPHPLIEATIQSVRPRLWEDYREIVEKYRSEGWGIYDDTADLDRAVAICDAYYGDGSSVVQLCEEAKKPIMLQNVEIFNKCKRRKTGVLSFGAFVENDKVWLPSKEINALFYVDLKNNNQVKYLTNFTKDNKAEFIHIQKVILYENELFFFSKYSFKVWIMNHTTDQMRQYEYCEDDIKGITNVEIVDGVAWIFSNTFEVPIVCLDLKSKTVERIRWVNTKYPESDVNTFTRIVKDGKKLYLTTRMENSIHLCCIDYVQKKIDWKQIQNMSFINCFTVKGEKCWVLGRNDSGRMILARYELKTMQNEEVIDILSWMSFERTARMDYFRMIMFKDKIFLIPALVKNIVVFDILDHTETTLQYPDNIKISKLKDDPLFFYELEQKGNKLYLYPYSSEQILILDMETLKFDMISTIYNEKEFNKAYEKLIYQNSIVINENENFYIEKFLQVINKNIFHKIKGNLNGIGKEIYKNCHSLY